MTTFAMTVPLESVLSKKVLAKADRMRTYTDEGWEPAEVAVMFGLSESWTKVLLRGTPVRRFFCKGCGAPALKKHAPCVRCDSEQVLADAGADLAVA